jgi:hypothetical protein
MSDARQSAELVAQLRANPTCDVATTARALQRSQNRLYDDIRRTGEVAPGIKVIRLGSGKTIRVPTAPLIRLLQLDADDPEATP